MLSAHAAFSKIIAQDTFYRALDDTGKSRQFDILSQLSHFVTLLDAPVLLLLSPELLKEIGPESEKYFREVSSANRTRW